MKTSIRRSLRRAWRVRTWPVSAHIMFALGTGLACGIAAARYPDVIGPPYAAILGTLIIYPGGRRSTTHRRSLTRRGIHRRRGVSTARLRGSRRVPFAPAACGATVGRAAGDLHRNPADEGRGTAP
jgi:hypothetical protein